MAEFSKLRKDMQPRERLLAHGAEDLELPELLAIILRTGYKSEDVMELSRRLFSDYSSKAIVGYQRVEDVMADFGLPKVKACQVVACFEIGRRMFQESENLVRMSAPEEVWKYVTDMHRMKKEYLRGLYLNTKHQVIHDEVLSIGTLDQSLAHPREIFAPALIHAASAIILVHNHPSGDLSPSEADLQLTRRVSEVGRLMSVPVLDHIIVSWKGYKSLI